MNGDCGLLGIVFLFIVIFMLFNIVLVFFFVIFLFIRFSRNMWLLVLLDIMLKLCFINILVIVCVLMIICF